MAEYFETSSSILNLEGVKSVCWTDHAVHGLTDGPFQYEIRLSYQDGINIYFGLKKTELRPFLEAVRGRLKPQKLASGLTVLDGGVVHEEAEDAC